MNRETPLGGYRRDDFPKLSGLLFSGVWIGLVVLSVLAQSSTPTIYRSEIEPHWFLNDSHFWYRNDNPGGTREFVVVDALNGRRAAAFDHSAVARQMGEQTDPERLPIEKIEFNSERDLVTLAGRDKSWELNLRSSLLKEQSVAVIHGDAPSPRTRSSGRRNRDSNATSVKSDDGQREAFVRDHNLWVRRVEIQDEKQLTEYGSATNSFHRDAIRLRAIGMNYDQADFPDSLPDVIWSPDSKKLIAIQTTVVPEPRVHLVVSSPAGQLQPKLDSYPYIKPGDPIPIKQLHMFDVESGAEIELDASMFHNPWDLSRIVWSKDSSRFYFLYNQRGHQVLRVLEVIPDEKGDSGAELETEGSFQRKRCAAVNVVMDEQSETFLDYSNKTYLNIWRNPKK